MHGQLPNVPPVVHTARGILDARRARLRRGWVRLFLGLSTSIGLMAAAGGVLAAGLSVESVPLVVTSLLVGVTGWVGTITVPFLFGAMLAAGPSNGEVADASAVLRAWSLDRERWATALVEPQVDLHVAETQADLEDEVAARDEVRKHLRAL